MTDRLKLDLPEIGFYGDNALAASAKKSYDLHAPLGAGGVLPWGVKPLPDELTLTDIQFSLQSSGDPSWEVPAGFAGRVAVFLDPGGWYEEEVDYPTQEDGHPRGLLPLAFMPIAPGLNKFIEVKPCLLGPTPYRRGDRLGVAVETNQGPGSPHAGKRFSVFASPIFTAPGRSRLLELDTGVVRAIPLNNSYAGAHPVGYRSLVPCALGGSAVTLRWTAREDGMVIQAASIGIQAAPGSPHMAAAPVPILFDGAASKTIPAHGAILTTTALNVAAGQTLVVHAQFGGCFTRKNATLSGRAFYTTTAGGHATATMPGTPMNDLGVAKATYGFDYVRVT